MTLCNKVQHIATFNHIITLTLLPEVQTFKTLIFQILQTIEYSLTKQITDKLEQQFEKKVKS